MSVRDDPALHRYRRALMSLAVGAAACTVLFAVVLAVRGRLFHAFLALCVGAYLGFVFSGYRREERDDATR